MISDSSAPFAAVCLSGRYIYILAKGIPSEKVLFQSHPFINYYEEWRDHYRFTDRQKGKDKVFDVVVFSSTFILICWYRISFLFTLLKTRLTIFFLPRYIYTRFEAYISLLCVWVVVCFEICEGGKGKPWKMCSIFFLFASLISINDRRWILSIYTRIYIWMCELSWLNKWKKGDYDFFSGQWFIRLGHHKSSILS